MQRPIVYIGHPILRKKTESVLQFDEKLLEVVTDLSDTLKASKKGVALAAPQIGVSLSIFATKVLEDPNDIASCTETIRVFINPKIVAIGNKTVTMEEGCLSVPGLYRPIDRPESVTFQAQDITGAFFSEAASGWYGRMLMHENDHLHGALFIDRLSKQEKKRISPLLSKLQKTLNGCT